MKILSPVSPYQSLYLFSKPVDFIIDMNMGTNVKVYLFISENVTSPINRSVSGYWSSSMKITANYTYPGDYKVTVVMSNEVSSVTITNSITLMSDVSGFIVELKNSPVIYRHRSIEDYGRAFFQFHYQPNTYAALYPTNVTISVGDTTNKVLGPFRLGLDYFSNISKTLMFYDYKTIGNYIAAFNFKNAISSKIYSLSISVVPALFGVYIKCEPPNVVPGSSVIIQVYAEQGDNVTYEFIVDGQSIGTQQRIC
jgi:hypothetical protein